MKSRSSGRPWRYWNPVILCVFVLFAGLRCSFADGVDDYVNRQMRRQHVAGLSLAVVKDGRLVKAKGYGFANLELKALAASLPLIAGIARRDLQGFNAYARLRIVFLLGRAATEAMIGTSNRTAMNSKETNVGMV